MTVEVARMLDQALLLPRDSRTELVEAILENTPPSDEALAGQFDTVLRRVADVHAGRSHLIPAAEAHLRVREALASGA